MGRADGHTKTLPLPISAVKQSRQSVHRNVVHHTRGKPTRRLFRFPRQDRLGVQNLTFITLVCRDILECNNTSVLKFLIARADDLILTVSNPCSSASCPECYPTHVFVNMSTTFILWRFTCQNNFFVSNITAVLCRKIRAFWVPVQRAWCASAELTAVCARDLAPIPTSQSLHITAPVSAPLAVSVQ